MKNKISVVIVTFNGEFWIEKNIKSLIKSSFLVEIIVVDNASTDNTVDILKDFPQVTLIQNHINIGFGKANNIGIHKAIENGATAVFLLNQDTWVFENTIGVLVDSLQKNSGIGIISPIHYEANGIDFDAKFKDYYQQKSMFHNQKNLAVVPFINAAAWLVSKKCFEKVGFFEPVFEHYGEDRNFCDRVAFFGFQVAVAKDSKICHDRVVSRNWNKDVRQSKYKVLIAFLNINHSIGTGFYYGLKAVFGMPKYFFQYYGIQKALLLFFDLWVYYFILIFKTKKIILIKKNHKQGKIANFTGHL